MATATAPFALLAVLLLHCVLFILPSALNAQQVAAQALIPAQFFPFHTMTDSQGSQWDFDQWGRVMNGTDSCFCQSFTLIVNNNMWRPTRSMMTPDGNELVLQGTWMHPGLEVTRRMHVDPKSPRPLCRGLQQQHREPMTVQMRIVLNSGNGGWPVAVSDTGQVNSAALGKQETGVVYFGPSQNGTLSVALCLAGHNSAVRPTLQAPMTGQPGFTYSFAVPPRKTASIIYGAGPVPRQQSARRQGRGRAVEAVRRHVLGPGLAGRYSPVGAQLQRLRRFALGRNRHWQGAGHAGNKHHPKRHLGLRPGTRLKGTASCAA